MQSESKEEPAKSNVAQEVRIMNRDKERIKELEERIDRLEEAVFPIEKHAERILNSHRR